MVKENLVFFSKVFEREIIPSLSYAQFLNIFI